METFLVCLVSLSFLAIQKYDFICNKIRDDFPGTTSEYLLRNLLFSILKCAREIHTVYAELY